MAYNHKAVGTLIHVDGLLEDPTWANGSAETLTKIYDTIERLTNETPQQTHEASEAQDVDSKPSEGRITPDTPHDADDPTWTVSAWPSSAGPWFVVHHRPTTYTIRTQSLDRLRDKIIHRFQSNGDDT